MGLLRSNARKGKKSGSPARARLSLCELENREVPTVTIADIPNQEIFVDRPLFIPVTVTNTPDAAVTVTAQSSNSNVTTEVLTGGRSLRLQVTGLDKNGVAINDTLTIRLFEDVAPLATGNIISLANQGWYNGKLFHRIIDGFMMQAGSANGDGLSGGTPVSNVVDEFNEDYTFASPGIMAIANGGRDQNNSQFFITDIDLDIGERPNFLNFRHSVVGILTEGFDTYTRIIQTPVTLSNSGENSKPVSSVTIVSATVFTDTENAVIKVSPATGFSGTADITVTANDGSPVAAQDGFTITGVTFPDNPNRSSNDIPFLHPIANVTTAKNAATAVSLQSTDLNGSTVTYGLTATGANASKVTIDLNNQTGLATLTPATDFTGTITLQASVSDAGGFPDTQTFTMTVNAVAATTTTTLTLSKSSTTVGVPIAIRAAVSGVTVPQGTIQFSVDGTAIGTANVFDGQATIAYTPSAVGSNSITATFTPKDSTAQTASSSPASTLAVTAGTAPRTFTASGAAVGTAPVVFAEDSKGTNLFSTTVYETSFTGGVRIATGDVTGDGQIDIVAVPGQGGAPLIKVIDGGTGQIVFTLMVFEDTFRGGLYVDVADFQGKGYSQILVGAGRTGGPRVTLYDMVQGRTLYNFFAYDSKLRGGVSVDAADVRGNGYALIVTGAGQGGGPIVAFWDGAKTAVINGQTAVGYGQAFFGAATNTEGIRVGTGTARADRTRLVLVGSQEPDTTALTGQLDPFTLGIFPAP